MRVVRGMETRSDYDTYCDDVEVFLNELPPTPEAEKLLEEKYVSLYMNVTFNKGYFNTCNRAMH